MLTIIKKNPEFSHNVMSDEQHGITQNELNDLGRDLELPKCTAGLLGSRLQQWKLLNDSLKISAFPFAAKRCGSVL